MMRKHNYMLFLFLFVLLLSAVTSNAVVAVEVERIQKLEEISLPSDLDFVVSKECSGHVYFMQATATENGWFAIYSRHVEEKGYSQDSFNKIYIDIYDAEGLFFQEISFSSPFDLAVELDGQILNMYFYESVLEYDIATQKLQYYLIPEQAAINNGLYASLRQDEFICGEWHYRCLKSFDGFTQLIRVRDGQEQVLINLPGTGNSFWNIFFPGLLTACLFVIVMVIARRGKS